MSSGAQTTQGPPKEPAKLQGAAATAALYVTNANRQAQKDKSPLEGNSKLSSAGAAASLKYATPRDLPSFPSAGLKDGTSSAGAAASLANANQKSFEHWKPEYSSPANRAAMLAQDLKAPALWRPEMSSAGSKAALLAATQGTNVNVKKPDVRTEGNSAAGQAMRNKNLTPSIDKSHTKDGRSKALMAATGAMSGISGRQRAGSSPATTSLFPDSANSAANALNAATVASKTPTKSSSSRQFPADLPSFSAADANRIHTAAVTNLGRDMYTSHPPVALEVAEKNRNDGLHAAAISMAKSMYDLQQRNHEQSSDVHRSDSQYAASSVTNRQPIPSATEYSYQAPAQYVNLQETAQKLASERLAKLHDEHAAYRNYYGAQNSSLSRHTVRGRMRRRASSDGGLPVSDEERTRQIRSQMSIFNDKLAQVDSKKQAQDRAALMATAQRNVTKSMTGMDEKVFADTGKVSPAMMAEWEAKARARAEAESNTRLANHGKVAIGGGRFMDQSDIDAIAAARVQPTLDEITAKAEADRLRDEIKRQEEEESRRIAEEKAQEEKERNMRVKEEWKRFKEEEKREQKSKKEEEKARKGEEKTRKAEEKRLQEEQKREEKEKHKSKVAPVFAATVAGTTEEDETAQFNPPHTPAEAVAPRVISSPTISGGETSSTQPPPLTPTKDANLGVGYSNVESTVETTISGPSQSSTSPKDDQGTVSTWLKSKFRRGSKPVIPHEDPSASVTVQPAHESVTAEENGRSEPHASSLHEVAMAGKEPHIPGSQSSSVSSISSDEPTSQVPDGQSSELKPVSSTLRDPDRSQEVEREEREESPEDHDDFFEEARDTFDPEKVPQPSFTTDGATGRAALSPARDSRFVEQL